MSPDPLALLRVAGFPVTHEIGRGMEGIVAALDEQRVVKVWDRRLRPDVERLRTFYDAVEAGFDQAGVRLAVPAHPDLALLPVPDGEPRFNPDLPFGDSLAALVLRRAPLVGRRLADGVAERLADSLRALTPVPPRLVHGDLGPVHVLLEGCRVVALLDFGYISTSGDPAFDAAVAAALQDMFGPGAAASTSALDDLAVRRFGYVPEVLVLYRAAYGLVTASCLAGHPGRHLDWCLALIDVWRASVARS